MSMEVELLKNLLKLDFKNITMKLITHLKILLLIAIIAGIIGGIGNYFIMNIKFAEMSFWRSIVLGIVAAGVLPIFLKLMSSNILEYHKDEILYKNYISFISLCLLASLFADTFLQGIYAKVFNDFSEKVEEIKTSVDNSNEKSDLVLTDLKAQKSKTTQAITPKHKTATLSKIARTYKLKQAEAKILYEIDIAVTITTEQLYKKGNKTSVDTSLKILQRKNLIRKVSFNNTSVFILGSKFRALN